MWKILTDLFNYIFETEADQKAPPPPIVFTTYGKLPKLFAFNREKLDVNLLIYPDSGRNAHRDAVLLLVYGCEEILGLDEVNEAYVCRKLGETRDRARNGGKASFEAVLSDTLQFNAQEIVNASVDGCFLRRLSSDAGGSLRLAAYARQHVEDMAYDLNERG